MTFFIPPDVDTRFSVTFAALVSTINEASITVCTVFFFY